MPSDIVFEPQGFKERAQSLRQAGDPEFVATRLNRLLRRVGKVLVPALKAATPVGATHHLRNYTHFRIFPLGDLAQRMEIKQSARSEMGYFYGMAVVGGTRPHFPPYRKLIPWVNAVLGIQGKKANSVAFLIARKISKEGTQPNPYPEAVLYQNMTTIQGIVNQEGILLAAELWKPRRI